MIAGGLAQQAARRAGFDPRDVILSASHTHAGRVREDFMSGVRSGVNRTPRLSTLLTYPHVATMSCHICLPVNAAVIRPRPGRSVE